MVKTLADVTLTGSAQQLTATPTKAAWVQVQGIGSNAAFRIGDASVGAARGVVVPASGGGQFFPPIGESRSYDLSQIYVKGTLNDTIAVMYGTR